MTEPTYHRAPDGTLFEKVDGRVRAIYDERGPAVNESYDAAVEHALEFVAYDVPDDPADPMAALRHARKLARAALEANGWTLAAPSRCMHLTQGVCDECATLAPAASETPDTSHIDGGEASFKAGHELGRRRATPPREVSRDAAVAVLERIEPWHVEQQFKDEGNFTHKVCRLCRGEWPCHARELLDLLATLAASEPIDAFAGHDGSDRPVDGFGVVPAAGRQFLDDL